VKLEHLKIEAVVRHPGGGQRVGVTNVGVRVTHVPTGLTAACSTERSQSKNRSIAMAMVEWGLAEVGWVE
jgi:protein subunit release factor A